MQNKYKDFDEFFKEQGDGDPILIKMFGKRYKISRNVPATVILLQYRAYKSTGEGELSDADQMQVALDVIGEKTLVEWTSKGMTTNQLTEVLKYAMEQIGKPNSEGDENAGPVKK